MTLGRERSGVREKSETSPVGLEVRGKSGGPVPLLKGGPSDSDSGPHHQSNRTAAPPDAGPGDLASLVNKLLEAAPPTGAFPVDRLLHDTGFRTLTAQAVLREAKRQGLLTGSKRLALTDAGRDRQRQLRDRDGAP